MNGLPQINITFKKMAETALRRSTKGVVAIVLKDDTTTTFDSKTFEKFSEVAEEFTADNKKLIEMAFMGNPKKVIVERLAVSATDYAAALARLSNKKWNYLVVPYDNAATEVVTYIKDARDTGKKTFKAVVANNDGDHEGIINFTTEGIKVDSSTYSAAQFTSRIAGVLAGLPLNSSATYLKLPEVTDATLSATADADIKAGKLILISNGENFKIARAVNSLTTLGETKGESLKKIKIVEGMDLMKEDIKTIFEDQYIGKVENSYDNKALLFAAINGYFKRYEDEGVLDANYVNKAEVDIEAQKQYLIGKGVDVSNMKIQDIKEANTGSDVYGKAMVKFLDAMEDIELIITM